MKIAISPCPNDIFIFNALMTRQIPSPLCEFSLMDIQELNESARSEKFDVIKVSAACIKDLSSHYLLLHAGSALGFGCGPLVLTRRNETLNHDSRVGIPGWNTTARLLFSHYFPQTNLVQLRFDQMESALGAKEIDAALIIHETRFSYDRSRFVEVADLGKLWEKETNGPLPLGVVLIHRRQQTNKILMEEAIRKSLTLAWSQREATIQACQKLAADLSPEVISAHIDLYVNQFSMDLGSQGLQAINQLENFARPFQIPESENQY